MARKTRNSRKRSTRRTVGYARTRRPAKRRSTSRRTSSPRTIRIVLQQASPVIQPGFGSDGQQLVTEAPAPRRSKF